MYVCNVILITPQLYEDFMKIYGSVEVTVDAIDIEQAVLRNRSGKNSALLIIDAALYLPAMKSMQLFCARFGHQLKYNKSQNIDKTNNIWTVTFMMLPIKAPSENQKIAEDCGLGAA
jgi:hypothetical protein